MSNYVYKIEITVKAVDVTHDYYFTSVKKVLKSHFSPLFKVTRGEKNCVVIDRIKECRGVTGIIFEFDSTFSHVTLRKIKPL